MGEKLVLIGGGGHCRSVLDAAIRSGDYSDIVITDPFLRPGTLILGCEVFGPDAALDDLKHQGFHYAFVSVGSIRGAWRRKAIIKRTAQIGFIFPPITDPSAVVSQYAQIGEGTFVGKKAVVNAGVKVGKHCIINTGAIIEHDCAVGDYSHISVGAILCGAVHIGNGSFIGAGTTVIQEIAIGENTIIGANSTVLTNIKDNQTVYGIIPQISGGG